jgi:hypothetical protein
MEQGCQSSCHGEINEWSSWMFKSKHFSKNVGFKQILVWGTSQFGLTHNGKRLGE